MSAPPAAPWAACSRSNAVAGTVTQRARSSLERAIGRRRRGAQRRRPTRSPRPATAAPRPAARSVRSPRPWCRWLRSPITRPAPRRWPSTIRACSSPAPSPSTSRPALSLGRRRRGDRRKRCAKLGVPAAIHGSFQGTAQVFQQSLANEPLLDPGGARRRLYRAGRALRELRPPDHDPLDAALGGRRRGARAAWLFDDRVQHHRPDRRHPAHRHRQEERDHDDRLRADAERNRRPRLAATRSSRPACCASGRS